MRKSGTRWFVERSLVVLALFGVACSGNSHGDNDDDNDNNSGRPPKVGLSVNIKNATSTVGAGRSCPTATGVQWDVGRAIRMNGMVTGVDSPTPQDYGSTLEDGEEGAQISCRVGIDDFEAIGSGTDPQITPPDGLIRFAFESVIGMGATGNLSVYTPRTGQVESLGAPPCTLTAVHEANAGALWADFNCPLLTTAESPALGCEASGTIVLEYCDTE